MLRSRAATRLRLATIVALLDRGPDWQRRQVRAMSPAVIT